MLVAMFVVACLPAAAGAHPSTTAPTQGSDEQGTPSANGGYSGLVPADAGPCKGGYKVQDRIPGTGCSHGPDLAPPGLSLTEPDPLSRLAEATSGATAGAVKCIGDGASGSRVEAIYINPADKPNQFTAALPIISAALGEMAEQVEDSAEETGGYRTLRFATSGCEPVVRNVTLSAQGDDSLGATASELYALGFNSPERDYLLFVDSDVYCGIGYVNDNYARVDTACWDYAPLHELIHNFGAVQLTAPNSSGGFHCTDESDRMCYSDEPSYPAMRQICPFPHERLLDCGNDDYFSTAPRAGTFLSLNPDYNTADSPFMADVDGEPPVLLPEAPFSYNGPRYVVRAYNADDDECVYGEGTAVSRRVRFFCIGYGGDRVADVTGALLSVAGSSPSAILRLVATDRGGGTAVGFTVYKDGTPIVDDRAGEAGAVSSGLAPGAPDPITGWPVFFDRAIAMDLSPLPPANPTITPLACRSAKKRVRGTSRNVRRVRMRLRRMHRSLKRQRARIVRHKSSRAAARNYRRRVRRYRRLVRRLPVLRRQQRRDRRLSRARCRQSLSQ